MEWLNLYHMCKTFNQLPHTGGVLDQPARMMYVFEGISAAESERDIRENEKRQREAARAGKR